jgi:hypothetical protein
MARGDVERRHFLAELKWTAASEYRLKHAALAKIEREAMALGKYPYFGIEFRHDGVLKNGALWIMVPAYVFETLLEDCELG